MNSIFTRRSVRTFKDQVVEPEKIERILRAGMQAPSANNTQPWEFIVVKDEQTRAAIADLNMYAKAANNCDTCLVILADTSKVAEGSTFWIQDLGACVENILLQTVEEDLGAVWLGYYPKEERVAGMQKIFNLPDHVIAYAVLAVGYPLHQGNKFVDRFDASRIHYETYTAK